MKKLPLILLCLSLTACAGRVPDYMKPAHRVFNHMPQDGSWQYEQGWQEGCESGMAGMTNSFYQSFYVFKQDNRLLNDEVYYKAWKDSYDYCKGYIYGILKEANLRRSLPQTKRHFFPQGGGDSVLGMKTTSGKTGTGFLSWMGNLGPGLFRW